MSAATLYILSLSILFPLFAGIFRWQRIRQLYFPLFILWITGLLSETIVWWSMKTGANWVAVNNLYILADSILVPIQFIVWGYLRLSKPVLAALLLMLLLWIGLHVWPGNITSINGFYRILYSLQIVLLTINSINYLLINERAPLSQFPPFLMMTGLMLFYTYQLLYETAYVFTAVLEDSWSVLLNRIFAVINFVCNLIYGIAICRVPANPLHRWRRS